MSRVLIMLNRYTKEEVLGGEEKDFITSYNGDFEIPHTIKLQKWLWGGVPFSKKHPNLKV